MKDKIKALREKVQAMVSKTASELHHLEAAHLAMGSGKLTPSGITIKERIQLLDEGCTWAGDLLDDVKALENEMAGFQRHRVMGVGNDPSFTIVGKIEPDDEIHSILSTESFASGTVWKSTGELRWFPTSGNHVYPCGHDLTIQDKGYVLQQLHTSTHGLEKWVTIPFIKPVA